MSKACIAILGVPGAGKTSLTLDLPPERTAFLDIELGSKSIDGEDKSQPDVFRGAMFEITGGFEQVIDFFCWIGGPDPDIANGRSKEAKFSQAHYQRVCTAWGDPTEFAARFDYVVADSISEATRKAEIWAEGQPEALADSGNKNGFAVYKLVADRMGDVIKAAQRAPLNVIFFGHLKPEKVKQGKEMVFTGRWEADIPGNGTMSRLDRIIDTYLTFTKMPMPDGSVARFFVCDENNAWGFPAKDRSGTLEPLEGDDLLQLITKINSGQRRPRYKTDINAVRAYLASGGVSSDVPAEVVEEAA